MMKTKIKILRQPNEERFNQALSLAQQTAGTPNIDDEALGKALNNLMLAMDTLNLDVAAYEKLEELTKELSDTYDASPYSEEGLIPYEDFLYKLEEIHDGRTFNPLEIDSIRPRADRMFKACVCEALIAGETQNADGLGTNLDFTGNNSGWTKPATGISNTATTWQKYGKAPLTKSIKNSPVCPKALIQFPYRLTTAREPMPTSRLRITPQTPKKMSFLIFRERSKRKTASSIRTPLRFKGRVGQQCRANIRHRHGT